MRLTSAGLALLVAALLAPPPATAQRAERPPERPELKAGVDTNDWQSYYAEGVRRLRRAPDKAEAYFYWASRLDPSIPEPMHARWVAAWRRRPELLKEYLDGAEYVVRSGEGARIDSLAWRALLRNPLLNQQLTLWIYEALPGEWSNDAYTEGWLHYSQGRHAKALEQWGKALQARGWLSLHYQRALAFTAMRQHDSAATELERLVAAMRRENRKRLNSVYESSAMYEYAIGRSYAAAGDLVRAREALGRALVEDLSLYMAHGALGELARITGDTTTAMQEYQTAVELAPDDAGLRFGFGNLLLELNRPEEAAAQYRAAIAAEPHYALPYLNLAIALDQLGRGSEAVPALEAFVARAPQRYRAQIDGASARLAELRRQGGD